MVYEATVNDSAADLLILFNQLITILLRVCNNMGLYVLQNSMCTKDVLPGSLSCSNLEYMPFQIILYNTGGYYVYRNCQRSIIKTVTFMLLYLTTYLIYTYTHNSDGTCAI